MKPSGTPALLLAALLPAIAFAQTPGAGLKAVEQQASATTHFDALGKPASKFTLELRNGQKASLP
ncbi:MAG: hypothetical protein WBV56_04465, partial [Azonexus sp.]